MMWVFGQEIKGKFRLKKTYLEKHSTMKLDIL